MAKRKSQRERDMARRARAKGKDTNADKEGRHADKAPTTPLWKNKKVLAGAGAVAVAALVVFAVLGQAGTPTTREGNLAAFGLDDDPYLGDPDAPVVVVGFEAPRCSSCRAFHAQLLPQLDAEQFQTGRAVFYYSQYWISDQDFDIGMMQECAFEHGGRDGFWDFTTRIYLELGSYPSIGQAESKMRQFASERGILDEVTACYDGRDTADRVGDDWSVGSDWDVRGTPTFYVFGIEGEAVQATAGQLQGLINEFHLRAQQAEPA